MQEETLDHSNSKIVSKEPKAIDNFFKAYVIFYSVSLFISFLLSLFNALDNAFIKLFFEALTFAVFGFHLVYFILLIAKKKGIGRILVHLLNSFPMLVVAIGFIFYFARWDFRLEMLTTGLITVPFILLVQVGYELAVRKDNSKFLSILSSLGISTFSMGVLFFLQKWPYGKENLIIGGVITLVMTIVHLSFVAKKEAKYQIHSRYLAQSVFALVAAILIFISQ
jgi:hypothetical protein